MLINARTYLCYFITKISYVVAAIIRIVRKSDHWHNYCPRRIGWSCLERRCTPRLDLPKLIKRACFNFDYRLNVLCYKPNIVWFVAEYDIWVHSVQLIFCQEYAILAVYVTNVYGFSLNIDYFWVARSRLGMAFRFINCFWTRNSLFGVLDVWEISKLGY